MTDACLHDAFVPRLEQRLIRLRPGVEVIFVAARRSTDRHTAIDVADARNIWAGRLSAYTLSLIVAGASLIIGAAFSWWFPPTSRGRTGGPSRQNP